LVSQVEAVFTGGSLLFGSVGGPDLVGPDATEELAHAQWHSVRTLVASVDDDAAALLDENAFVAELLEGLDAFPA
jgi:hypothetical protein